MAGEVVGYGEASPNAYYGETAEGVLARLEAVRPRVEALEIDSPEEIARAWETLWPHLAPSRAAQCALDLALWDWLARRRSMSVAELAFGQPPHPVRTFCTIGISTRAELEEKLRELRGFPAIKIKASADMGRDLETIRFVRERTEALLAVDANAAWRPEAVPALSGELARLGVEFLEQPLPPGEEAQMPRLLANTPLPLLADESCVRREDVERMPGVFSGFNIKLVKCGGLTPGLAMLRRGRELGLRVMVGCMLESSLLISAGAVLAQRSDDADLDGAWLLADDPFAPTAAGGTRLRNGMLEPASGPGFGVTPTADLFA